MPNVQLINRRLIILFVLIMGACSEKGDVNRHSKGVDVSHFQGDIDWQALRKDGIAFTYIKASEGMTIIDPFLSKNWAGAKREKIVRGGYHVFTAGDDGKKQADQFLLSFKKDKLDYNGALPPVLDIEEIPKDRMACAKPEIKKWLKQVEAALGCKPVIYTSPDTWDEEFPGSLTGYNLWVADYNATPTLPKGWEKWTFWQHSNAGHYAGIDGQVDLDRFNGDSDDLRRSTCLKW